jgi:hypothetical protein
MVAAWNLTGNANVNDHTKVLGTKDSHALVIKTNNQEAARVDPSGNVGIGTTAPNAPLQIGSATYTQDSKIILGAGNGGQQRIWSIRVPYGDAIVTAPNYGFVIRDETGGTDRFVIDWQTGNVGIGTTTPGIANFNLANSGGSVGLYVGDPSIAPYGQAMIEINPPSGATHIWAQEGGTLVFSVTSGGNAYFAGNVSVDGDVTLTNADCAEDFNISGGDVEPGTVMVLGDQDTLKPSEHAYDKRVAGVISGAGDYKPGIVLDKQPSQRKRSSISLLGKVFCKVDARYGSIAVGDMLTTSNTPGHAMKANDPFKAFGSVIGKALRPLREGQGLIPILIALQ